MSESKSERVNANNSTIHTADNKSAIDIDFLRLTTDICYVIGGFFGGKFPEGEIYLFLNDYDDTIWLDMDEKVINVDDRFTRTERYALEKIADDHGFEFDILTNED